MPRKLSLIITIILYTAFMSGCSVDNDTTANTNTQSSENKTTQWETIAQGIEFTQLRLDTTSNNKEQSKNFILVRIDPRRAELSIYQNFNQSNAKTIQEIHKEQNALITVNGQFFSQNFTPTGLLISNNQELYKISNALLVNGIIAIHNNSTVEFFNTQEGIPKNITPENYQFAIQNGPILVDAKGQPALSNNTNKLASRTALGLDENGNLIFIIIKQSILDLDNSISLYEFARLLTEHPTLKPLKLHSTINLDGGPSTGIMIGDNYYSEMEKVQNVILIKARNT